MACWGTPLISRVVSLQQMILFGQQPSQGTLLKASQFLSEELPIRLSHRVVELESLPFGISQMPSICKVKEWYAQSFEVSPFPPPYRPDLWTGTGDIPKTEITI